MKQLKSTYLVQRLNKPFNPNNQMAALANAFSFGGGLKNGGLSEDAMKLLSPVFSFDYMGSSEFEWGAIPKCLQSLAKNIEKYSAHEIELNKVPVYVICQTDMQKEIDKRIKELAECKHHLKEWSNFDTALGLSKWSKKEDCRQIGWLELDNEFMFFTDKTAFEKTAEIFGLSPAYA
jgi:hypothetical protein